MTFKINTVKGEENQTKRVFYFNYAFTVPVWVRYLVTDADGSLMGYEIIPVIDEFMGWWDSATGPIESVARLDYDGDWRDSLVEV